MRTLILLTLFISASQALFDKCDFPEPPAPVPAAPHCYESLVIEATPTIFAGSRPYALRFERPRGLASCHLITARGSEIRIHTNGVLAVSASIFLNNTSPPAYTSTAAAQFTFFRDGRPIRVPHILDEVALTPFFGQYNLQLAFSVRRGEVFEIYASNHRRFTSYFAGGIGSSMLLELSPPDKRPPDYRPRPYVEEEEE